MDWRSIVEAVQKAAANGDREFATQIREMATSGSAELKAAARLARVRRAGGVFMDTAASPDAAPLEPTIAPGERIGAWRIEGFIGAGGMGEVYRARRADGRYDQIAALKILQRQYDSHRLERFKRERQRVARLDHPGVTRIIDGGETGCARPYMVMEFVSGQPIDAYCRDRALAPAERIRLLCELCAATAHAHARLVLHRDIKASNVLVREDGSVKLIDFGISSLIDDAEDGAAPLTFATAAPEQLFGEPATVQTDVFAIGVLAHELFAGSLPTRMADGGVAVDKKVLGSADMTAIIERALSLSPDARYPTADALSRDLAAAVEHRPVAARNPSFAYQAGKFVRRNMLVSLLGAAAVLATASGFTVSWLMTARATDARERAEFYLRRAELTSATQTAYADGLQRLFAHENDAERIEAFLLNRAQEAYAAREADPDRAAVVAYAVGRSFVDRLDFANGIAVLEPWITEGYGDVGLVNQGRVSLAVAYGGSLNTERALALLAETEAYYEQGLRAGSPEHVVSVVQTALLTDTPEEMARAQALLEDVVGQDIPQPFLARSLDYLEVIYSRTGQFQLGYETALRVIDLQNSNVLLELQGQTQSRGVVAWYEIFLNKDFDSAERLLSQIIDDSEQQGEEPALWETYQFMGCVHLYTGQFAEAEIWLRRSQELLNRYVDSVPPTSLYLAEVAAAQGEFDRAQDLLFELIDFYGPVAPMRRRESERVSPRIALSMAFVETLRAGPEAGSAVLVRQGVTRAAGDRQLVSRFYIEWLEEMGVTIPEPT